MSDEMIELILADTEERMASAVSHTRREFSGIRTGRATPVLVEKIGIDYYGGEVPLQQIASFSVPEARTLLISPFDNSSLDAIEKAIRESDLGLTPSSDGSVLRLSFPPLTEQRRKELVKVARSMAEDGRIAIRNSRRSARNDLDKMKRDGEAPEDTLGRAETKVDGITRRHESQIDQALETKEQELLEV